MPLCPVTVIIISLYFLGVRKFGKNRLHFFKRRLFICNERTGVNHSASNRSYYASHSKLIWQKSYYICANFKPTPQLLDQLGLYNSFLEVFFLPNILVSIISLNICKKLFANIRNPLNYPMKIMLSGTLGTNAVQDDSIAKQKL